jgi:hypothetical protein
VAGGSISASRAISMASTIIARRPMPMEKEYVGKPGKTGIPLRNQRSKLVSVNISTVIIILQMYQLCYIQYTK